MRALDQQLALLHFQKAQGVNVDDAIANTLIAMVKESYVCGDVDLDYLESLVDGILRGKLIGLLAPGERVIRKESARGLVSEPEKSRYLQEESPASHGI